MAALIALADWGWVSTISPFRAIAPTETGVTINGTRIDLTCDGHDSPTVIIVGAPLVQPLITPAVREELIRFVRLCTLTVQETATRLQSPPIADVLRGLLIGGKVPGPYAFIAYASESTVSGWVTGQLAAQTAGFVLFDPTPGSGSFAITRAGNQWPVPTGGTDATVLAILKLFWPPDEG